MAQQEQLGCLWDRASIGFLKHSSMVLRMLYRTSLLFQPFLLLVDLIGYILFFWLKFIRMPEPKRILLIRLEHVGDVLMATPAIRALRKRYPRAVIDVLVRDFTAPILQKNRNVSKVIVWNAPWLSSLGSRASWSSVSKMIRSLRGKNYDIAVDFHGDPRNILFARKIAKYAVGFGARGFGFLLNKAVPYGSRHAIDRNLALVQAVGAKPFGSEMEMPVSASDRRVAAKLVPTGRWVCIAPGSGRAEKNWLPERWAAVADELVEHHNMRVVFTGSRRENELVQGILNRMRQQDKALNIAGKTSLSQLAAVLERCLLVLCPDSGTMHIARAVKTPLIGLFAVENPKEWGYDEPRFSNVSGRVITVKAVMDKVRAVEHKI